MIWDPKHESMPAQEMRILQVERLKHTLEYVYERVPFYRNLFDQHGLIPRDLGCLEDLRAFPFTTKEHLRDNYPFGLMAVPLEGVVRLHASSGTTGRPTVVGYTARDIETWAEMMARIITQAGVGPRDIAQVAFGYGLFTGAFGLHYGLERVGATVIPASSGNTERQLVMMRDFGVTALVSTPSYALHMAETAQSMGIAAESLRLRVGLFGAEPWTEGMRQEIQRAWGITATDNYGLSEVIGPGVAGECPQCQGLHISEDHFYPEVIDPETGEPLGPGEKGELVFTSLTKEGLPVVRYRTRDISALHFGPCPCGRTTARMERVSGRTDDMLIVRGVNIFPSQVESVLMDIEGISPHYQLVVERRGYLNDLEVQVELTEQAFTGSFRDLEMLGQRVEARLRSALSINPRVKLLEPRTIDRSPGKAKRIVENGTP
ncbi:MAG: phenylacetate--CoA ligase [Bacillota bacterium]